MSWFKSKTVVTISFALNAILVSGLTLTACSAKAQEQYNDAGIINRNSDKAWVFDMPDGFSNFAAKCDGSNMVYVLFKGNSAYGGITVVPNDSRCKK